MGSSSDSDSHLRFRWDKFEWPARGLRPTSPSNRGLCSGARNYRATSTVVGHEVGLRPNLHLLHRKDLRLHRLGHSLPIDIILVSGLVQPLLPVGISRRRRSRQRQQRQQQRRGSFVRSPGREIWLKRNDLTSRVRSSGSQCAISSCMCWALVLLYLP